MLRRILAYFFWGLGFLTITFFKHYTGELIAHPFLFWLIGFAMFATGVWLFFSTPSAKEESFQNRLNETIQHLKQNGEQIRIDLRDCELKEHNYTEERERSEDANDVLLIAIERNIHNWSNVASFDRRNLEQVQIKQTVIVFSRHNNRTGHIDKFISRVIPKDKVTLAFYLDQQKHTTLYVDKSNSAIYYFDLDFLES